MLWTDCHAAFTTLARASSGLDALTNSVLSLLLLMKSNVLYLKKIPMQSVLELTFYAVL